MNVLYTSLTRVHLSWALTLLSASRLFIQCLSLVLFSPHLFGFCIAFQLSNLRQNTLKHTYADTHTADGL